MTRIARRRGMALVLVLGLLAITLAASYALLRTQSYDRKIMMNHARRGDARANAQIGMATALRRMHDGSWDGADSTFTVDLDASNSFTVTYVTGDSTLVASGTDGWKIPYRETITITGKSRDPLNAVSESTHQIQVVTEFVRRKLNTNRVAVSDLEQHSIYQYGTSDTQIQFPFRINGNACFHSKLKFSENYPTGGAEYNRYFDDLELLRTTGTNDCVPFSGTIRAPYSIQGAGGGDLQKTLMDRLNTTHEDITEDHTVPIPASTTVSNYRLYPGGKLYNTSILPTSFNIALLLEGPDAITAGTYAPDPVSNPLGVRTLSGKNASVRSNTTITGTIESFGSTSSSNVNIAGDNITINPVNLPALTGDPNTYQLAAVRAAANVWILGSGTNRTMNGLYSAANTFGAADGVTNCYIDFNGTGCGATFRIGKRLLWDRGATYWDSRLADFNAATTNPKYFPKWMADNRSGDSFFLDQRLVFNPTPAGIKYHVPDWSQPVYVAHDADGGLLWDVVRMTETQ